MGFTVQLLVSMLLVGFVGLGSVAGGVLDNTPVPEDLVSSLLGSSAASTDAVLVTNPVCETSSGSPSVGDVLTSIDALPGGSTQCGVNNNAGSHCTQMKNYGSAALGICGTYHHSVLCDQLKLYFRNMVSTCQSGGKIGGYQYLNEDAGLRVIVYHT